MILLNEAAQRDGVPLPDLVSSAQQIREAIKSLVLAAQALVSETTDDVSCILNRSSEKIHSFFLFDICKWLSNTPVFRDSFYKCYVLKIDLAQIREKNCSKCVLVMMGIEVKKSIFGNFELLEKMSSV